MSRMLSSLRMGLCLRFSRTELGGTVYDLFLLRGGAGWAEQERASPTTCKRSPFRWSSTNLSSDTPLLMSIFTISITTAYSSCGGRFRCAGEATLRTGANRVARIRENVPGCVERSLADR